VALFPPLSADPRRAQGLRRAWEIGQVVKEQQTQTIMQEVCQAILNKKPNDFKDLQKR